MEMEAVTPTCSCLSHPPVTSGSSACPTLLTLCLTLSCKFTRIGAIYKVLGKDSKRGLQASYLSTEG